MSNDHLPIALTMGEPGGIGAEIALKCWRNHGPSLSPYLLIDVPDRVEEVNRQVGLNCRISKITTPDQAVDAFKDGLPVLDVGVPVAGKPGQLYPENGGAVTKSIELAVTLVSDGKASAMVTNPIHKRNLYAAGFDHPGHTEFLAALAGVPTEPVMMLASDRLRVVPVTRHVSLTEAIATLSASLIVESAEVTAHSLMEGFGIAAPRIAIAGLNPHAGEGGAMGKEETEIIEPAIVTLRAGGMDVSGPLSADTLFHDAARDTYDAVLCMYHDQALIPIKTLDFDTAVNVTLGLPFIRTSPDHGTALDIAGKGIADETSLAASIRLATDLARNKAATA